VLKVDLNDFDVSPTRGFLPLEDPLLALSNEHEPWEDAIQNLSKRLMSGRVRNWLGRLPRLETDGLIDSQSLNRAMLILSYLGHAWVWGEQTPSDRIPENIARPWCEVAHKLGRPPVLSYSSHALNNWRRLDQSGRVELGNIVRLANFWGGLDEEWFVLIHIAIEAAAGPALLSAVELQESLHAQDPDAATQHLVNIAGVVRTLIAILERMRDNCDPYIYYHRVRQFIFGWENNPALPSGVYYEGVSDGSISGKKFRGETGAQSSIIPTLDAALGLKFVGNELFMEHLLRLRDYMPPKHRMLIRAMEQNEADLKCREFVIQNTPIYPSITDAFNSAIAAMHDFRALHLNLAGSYIARQDPHSVANPTAIGTGGTPFMIYLNDHVKQTLAQRV
jgi:indoleamine 2,3-dioxygenase